MAKRGRKPIEINWEEFEALCAIQATLREMALFFNCSERTIERAVKKQYKANFVNVFAQKRLKGFISLRRQIWQFALRGNKTLLIFLAKQYLGMADQVIVNLPGPPPRNEEQIDLTRLTDAEVDELERLLESAHCRKLLPASAETTITVTPQKADPSAGLRAEPAPSRSVEVAPTPFPVNPTDQT